MKKLYRFEIEYKSYEEETKVVLREYPVLRETDHMYFIRDPYSFSYPPKEKRVLKSAMNKFAFDTEEEAKDHFIRRTTKRIQWFEFWIDECKTGLNLIEHYHD